MKMNYLSFIPKLLYNFVSSPFPSSSSSSVSFLLINDHLLLWNYFLLSIRSNQNIPVLISLFLFRSPGIITLSLIQKVFTFKFSPINFFLPSV
jgi:hypothetical protein